MIMSLNMSEFEARVRDSQSSEPLQVPRLGIQPATPVDSDLSVIGISLTPRSETDTIHPTSAASSPKSKRTRTTPRGQTKTVKPSTPRIVMKGGRMNVSSATIKV